MVTAAIEYIPLRGAELLPGTLIEFCRPVSLWLDPEFPIHLDHEGIPTPAAAIVTEYSRPDGYISLSWKGQSVLLEGWDILRVRVLWSPPVKQESQE